MFVSYEYKGYLDYNDKEYYYLYKIIDSDFEEETVVSSPPTRHRILIGALASARTGRALIEVYEKRNLNVAANLALLFQYKHNKYEIKISDLIKWNKEHNHKYLKYSTDVERLILWI